MVEPVKELDLSKLKLIVKSKNGPGRPVYREDLPKVLFNRCPRKLLGAKWFDNYTKNLVKICNNCGSLTSIERHEYYSLYKYGSEYIIKLEGVIPLCSKCHKKVHGGFSNHLGMKTGFILEPSPFSNSNTNKYPWNLAKYILVEDKLYPLF